MLHAHVPFQLMGQFHVLGCEAQILLITDCSFQLMLVQCLIDVGGQTMLRFLAFVTEMKHHVIGNEAISKIFK